MAGYRIEHTGGKLGAHRVDGRLPVARRPHQSVDNRQIELAILRTELIDYRAAAIDQIQLIADPADPHRPPLGHHDLDRRWQYAPQRDVGDPRRLEQPAAARVEVCAEDAGPVETVDQRFDLATRESNVTSNHNPADLERRGADNEVDCPIEGVADDCDRDGVPNREQQNATAVLLALARLHAGAPEALFYRGLHAHIRPPPAASGSSRDWIAPRIRSPTP